VEYRFNVATATWLHKHLKVAAPHALVASLLRVIQVRAWH
jgi:hypothetical protein